MQYLRMAILLPILALASAARAEPSALRDSLISNITFMKSVYQAEYAPRGWKKQNFGWDLDAEIARAIKSAQESPNLTLPDARKILKSFIYSMKDYHVDITFQSTERAGLPLTIQGAGANPRRYFIAHIDREKLTQDAFPFQVGDEVVKFGDLPTADAVAQLQTEHLGNTPDTDQALAELLLTARPHSMGYDVPHGPITLLIKPKGAADAVGRELIWDYAPERVVDRTQRAALPSGAESNPQAKSQLSPMMSVDLSAIARASGGKDNPFGIGVRRSFVPALGEKIWETADSEPFYAYIYQTDGGKLAGYVRIPSYLPEDPDQAVAAFQKIIEKFQKQTSALVIDQVNNPGGAVFYLYALAAMLTDQPLLTPQHEMAIVQADVLSAEQMLEQLNGVKDDASAKQALGQTFYGFPVSYEVVRFAQNYYQFILDEWKAGRRLSRPYWIRGVDKINPAPVHYSKPILLLTNSLDFSGGDFFPAILQDNKRVTILGTRTAGAGGYVSSVTYPNDLGIASFTVTESIAKRVDENPIENLGVTPDVPYQLTERDLTENYADYLAAIRATLGKLLNP